MSNPMLDLDFLKKLDKERDHEVYAKIIALTLDEHPTEEITGKVTQGSVSIDGTSAVRRSCSLNMVAKDVNINDFYWGLNTKFKLFVGLRNQIDKRYEDIIWFPQGVFLITSFNTSLSGSNYSISLQGKDKMCLLNGDIGGAITALSVDFGKYDQQDEQGNMVTYDYLIKEIIRESVHQYAGEPYHNIIINDLDDIGFELMEYRGDVDIFMLINADSGDVMNMRFNDDTLTDEYYIYDAKKYFKKVTEYDPNIPYYELDANGHYRKVEIDQAIYNMYGANYFYTEDNDINRFQKSKIKLNDSNFVYDTRLSELDFDTNLIENFTHVWVTEGSVNNVYTVARITYGDTCGYRLTDLTYAGDLIGAAGSSITSSVLDKIVHMLGEFEYFYNTEGQFVFQRKKTYAYNSWNSITKDSETINREADYADNAAYSSAFSYSFTDSNLITSFQNAPDLLHLRNDYAIWGERTSSSGSTIPIHLRYAIDKKPDYYKAYDGQVYTLGTVATYEEWVEKIREEITTSIRSEIEFNKDFYEKQPNPNGLPEEWWEIKDWANYYYQLQGIYPPGNIGQYANRGRGYSGMQPINLGKYFDINEQGTNRVGMPVYRSGMASCYIFDIDYDEIGEGSRTVGYVGHGYGCGHLYSYFTERVDKNIGTAYIYDPTIPELEFQQNIDKLVEEEIKKRTDFIQSAEAYEAIYKSTDDWREIIYQMAKDYFQHQHDDDFILTIAKNNPAHYPTGYTGYEQYYTDIQGFWRQLYNPEVELYNVSELKPDSDINHYYLWHPETETFTDYTFREATDLKPVEINQKYYYFNGTRTLESLIIAEESKLKNIEMAQTKKSRELAALVPGDANYAVLKQRIENHYDSIIEENNDYKESLIRYGELIKMDAKASGRPALKNTIISLCNHDKTILKNTTISFSESDSDEVLLQKMIKLYYPNYEQITADSWKDYVLYNTFDENRPYFLLQFVKDLTTLSTKDSYYTLANNGVSFEKVTTYKTIEDKTAALNENGTYQTKSVPSFALGKKYYTYQGYEKVSTLEVGENGNTYYTYNAYKIPVEYIPEAQYYLKTEQGEGELLFTKTSSVTPTMFASNPNIFYIRIDNPSTLDKSIVWGYSLILSLNKDITYYNLMEDKSGNVTPTTPSYFTRGQSYYSKNTGSTTGYSFEFTFERGIVYYLYKGYTEVLDLSDLSYSKDYFYEYASDDESKVKTFLASKVYYGFIHQDPDNIKNGKYYIKTNATAEGPYENTTFEEVNVLKNFVRGSTYYVNADGFDLFDNKLFTTSLNPQNLYVNTTGLTYITADTLIRKYLLNNVISDENAVILKTSYGLLVDRNGALIGINSNYKFYTRETKYREFNYYQFGFYEPAIKWDQSKEYFIYVNKEYKKVINPIKADFDKGKYFVNIKNSDVKICFTDEFNLNTHWTYKLEYPELLNFWFDFLDPREGELAQYSSEVIGNRPKTIKEDTIKAIYYRDTPTVIFLGVDGAYIQIFVNSYETFEAGKAKNLYYEKTNNGYALATSYSVNKRYYRKMTSEDKKPGYTYVYLTDTIDNLFSISSQGKTAYDSLNDLLYDYSYCTESITLNTIPIYYLQPNTRIFVRDDKSGINGEYLITRINLPLQYNGMMSITATKAVKRIK